MLIFAVDLPDDWLAALVVWWDSFDHTYRRLQEYQVRILDAGKYEATQRLQQNCVTLTSKVEQLNGLVKTYLEVLDKQVFFHWLPCIYSNTTAGYVLIRST